MTHEEFKAWALARFDHYLKEFGFKTRAEQDKEDLEGIVDRLNAPLEERAEQLRRAGIGIDHIAVCLGVNRRTVIRMRNPEAKERYNAYMREYMRRYRARNKGE